MTHGYTKTNILCMKLIEMLVGILIGKDQNLVNLQYKLNQYYDWHYDSWDKPYDRKDPNNPEHGRKKKTFYDLSTY